MKESIFKDVLLLRPFMNSSYQYFMQWFGEACERFGMEFVASPSIPWKVRLAVAKFRLSFKLPEIVCSRKILVVPCGGYPDSFAFPFAYTHEIIPVLWDTWPRYHERIVKSFIRHNVRLAFFTQRQVAEMIQLRLPQVHCVWLPEGIKTSCYQSGDRLDRRTIDLLELGRLLPRFHSAVKGGSFSHRFKEPSEGLLFKDFSSLCAGLSDAKITVCFPRCDTHPDQAGNIETLTQRYWECMLSRTVILGRCPKELFDFLGFNPVVDVDWDNPCEQVEQMVAHIKDYQNTVDRNYEVALAKASWDVRMPMMQAQIQMARDEAGVS